MLLNSVGILPLPPGPHDPSGAPRPMPSFLPPFLDEERVLKSLAPSDRLALRGRDNLLGVVYGRKLMNPVVKSFEKVEQGGKAVGAKASVSLTEVDPLDSTQIPKERTWFLALDGNQLRVSLLSVWLDAGKVQEAAQEGSGE